jgi:transcriptional regulator with GAF, ATPase, and Fis domain
LPQDQILSLCRDNAENAIKLAAHFGVEQASVYIPGANRVEISTPVQESNERSDIELMQIMREITNLLCGEFDLNLLFDMIIEGVYRGLSMDRVVFALLTPDRKRLREKSSLGWAPLSSRGLIQISVADSSANIFSYTLEKKEPLWFAQDDRASIKHLFTPEVLAQFGQQECCLSPVGVDKRVIGLFYTDRASSKKPITADAYADFKQLTRQANIALKLRYIH